MECVPTASQLLDVCEQARSQTPVQRALTLFALAAPAEPLALLARSSIGRRDQELLGLRERIFGSIMTGAAKCPACSQAVEVEFSVADIRGEAARDTDEFHVNQLDGFEVHFRLPNSNDLASLDSCADAPARKAALLGRCVAQVCVNDASFPAEPLPETVAAALSERMTELDPQADIQLTLTCPACGRLWTTPIDIVSFFWSELNAWAVRTLSDVHTLASSYGWREADILALSPWRRQAYLEMIGP
jgi:hypothetical protein